MSDATQFLMERDRASLEIRQKARKMRLFGVCRGFSALKRCESQREKADLQRF
jgi:gamma-glutamyl-gamma-aminobutyrate hydrolase PuuD